ncbi:MAG TPA: hypothetical protein VLH56_06550 [Dissulfurispiraceae bacterium]|nr:hypothetical protein [Dissulfurispiraceae bacterium]
MQQKNNPEQIRKQFWARQLRQFVAMLAAIALVFLMGYLYKRTELFGENAKEVMFGLQAIVAAAFIGFSAMNWRCPVCGKYMGADINRNVCKKCNTRLQ